MDIHLRYDVTGFVMLLLYAGAVFWAFEGRWRAWPRGITGALAATVVFYPVLSAWIRADPAEPARIGVDVAFGGSVLAVPVVAAGTLAVRRLARFLQARKR